MLCLFFSIIQGIWSLSIVNTVHARICFLLSVSFLFRLPFCAPESSHFVCEETIPAGNAATASNYNLRIVQRSVYAIIGTTKESCKTWAENQITLTTNLPLSGSFLQQTGNTKTKATKQSTSKKLKASSNLLHLPNSRNKSRVC